jgi:hypothetical protein
MYESGELLDPRRQNANLDYLVDGYESMFSRRYCHSAVLYPFRKSITGTYSNSDSTGVRSYRFYAFQDTDITRMYCDGYTSTGTAYINIYDVATGAAPKGVANPVFTITTTQPTSQDLYAVPVTIPSGSTYRWEISGTFTTAKVDLIVHFRTDAWANDSVSPSVTYATEAEPLDGYVWDDNLSALADAMPGMLTASPRRATLYVQHNITSSTHASRNRWEIPVMNTNSAYLTDLRFPNGVVFTNIVGMFAHAVYASAGSAGNTVTWTIYNSAGVSQMSAACDMNGVSEDSATATGFITGYTNSTSTSASTGADYYITVANNSATNCTKTYCYIFWG